ncbi:MAG: hypothetical protein OXT65_03400 [Alphaproteobacteria bacterium]|nr:hypothetical protein [Alphaproteobacteria bacterium]
MSDKNRTYPLSHPAAGRGLAACKNISGGFAAPDAVLRRHGMNKETRGKQ